MRGTTKTKRTEGHTPNIKALFKQLSNHRGSRLVTILDANMNRGWPLQIATNEEYTTHQYKAGEIKKVDQGVCYSFCLFYSYILRSHLSQSPDHSRKPGLSHLDCLEVSTKTFTLLEFAALFRCTRCSRQSVNPENLICPGYAEERKSLKRESWPKKIMLDMNKLA